MSQRGAAEAAAALCNTAPVPIDVAARVISNRALSSLYNVLTLDAPAIAASATPGQFVMVKARRGHDPMLRRPFSVFEVLRDDRGTPSAISILNKRIGPSTELLYAAQPDQQVDCLGPLGRSFTTVDAASEGWMVAGGVGLAPFAELAVALRRNNARAVLFYGARNSTELFYLDFFRDLGVELVLTTEDGSQGERGRVVAPLERRLAELPATAAVMVYACGPEGMLAAVAKTAARYGRPCQVSVERVMGCGLGGCYSCVVPMRSDEGRLHHVRSCLAGPVLAADQVVWD
jgi:dihydroorotate dehydrogenase electron transfer subunit